MWDSGRAGGSFLSEDHKQNRLLVREWLGGFVKIVE